MALEEEGTLRVEELLARSDWIRSLAASLVRDPHRAEDLAQSTIALALERHSASGVPPQRWIAAVMRNLLRQDLRSARRRQDREERAARPEAMPSESELLDRLEVQRRVVDAVRALEEPYRSTILLRYFEGLTPTEIAARTGTPPRTVHSRLNRGLQVLRQRLDTELGDRRAWLALLLPLAPGKAGSLGAAGGALVSTKVVVAAGSACALIAVVWVAKEWSSRSRPEIGASVPAVAERLSIQREAAPSVTITDLHGSERVAVPLSEVVRSEPAAQPDVSTRVEGRVIDVEGRSVAGAGVYSGGFAESDGEGVRTQSSFSFRWNRLVVGPPILPTPTSGPKTGGHTLDLELAPPIAVSGPDGRFSLSKLPDHATLHARSDTQVPILASAPDIRDPNSPELVLVVAETAPIAGVVVDDRGRPLEGVDVFVRVPDESREILGARLDPAYVLETFVRSGTGGRFQLPHAPAVERRTLHASLPGHGDAERTLTCRPEPALVIVLESPHAVEVPLRGIVVHPDGSPAFGASVALGHESVRTEADGRFVLEAKGAPAGSEIVAEEPGFAPDRTAYDPSSVEVRLQLGQATRSLAGRVVDPLGNPMPAVEILVADTDARRGHPARTDSAGRFEIGGLLERRCFLNLLDRHTLQSLRAGPFPAGENDIEIRFWSDDRTGRIAGRVVDRTGSPVARAKIVLARKIVRRDGEAPSSVDMESIADPEGRFEFRAASLDVQSVLVAFDRDLPIEYPVDAGEDLERLVLVAYHRAHFRVDLTGSGVDADAFELLDPAGRRLAIARFQGSMSVAGPTWSLVDGRSEIVSALDAAETLVLRRGEKEISRIPVRLAPGEVKILRP